MKKIAAFIFFFILLVSQIINLIKPSNTNTYLKTDCEEYSIEKTDSNQRFLTEHKRNWSDFLDESCCLSYSLKESQSLDSKENYDLINLFNLRYDKNTYLPIDTALTTLGLVYKYLYKHDKNEFAILQDSLQEIKTNRALNDKEFAELIVTMIQDIPYNYVYGSRSCDERPNKSIPCSDGHYYGLITPVNFMYELIGDCDTRALLLYTILKNFNYDVAIVTSIKYKHAMLAINLSYSGDYIEYQNKKYYFWETTAKNWQAGILPPTCNNKNYWEVALQ